MFKMPVFIIKPNYQLDSDPRTIVFPHVLEYKIFMLLIFFLKIFLMKTAL